MDTEPPSNFRSIFAKFEDAGCSKTQPANPPPAPNISNVRSNPALADVISALENQPKITPIPISKKPELPTKPSATVLQRETSRDRPPVPSKEKLSSAKDMRLNKGLRHTLYMADSPRSDGDGVCSKSPQVYRQSWPAVLHPKHPPGLDANQSDNQDCYEVIDDFNTKENPPLSLRGPLKSQTSNVSRQHSSQSQETNLSDNADCYEDVDNVKANAKPSLPYLAHLKSKVSFSEEKPSPMMEASQSDGPDCYEFIDDSLNTPILPPSHFTAPSSSSKPKALPGPEMSQSDGQGCYEEVDSTFHTLAERLPPFGGNSKLCVSFPFPEPPDIALLNEPDGQGQYEPVNSIFDLHIEPPPPFNDPPISKKNLPTNKPKSKPFRSVETNDKTTLSDRSPDKEDKLRTPPDPKNKPRKNIPMSSTPRKKPLPSIPSLGLPPPKEPRPPQVDLAPYRAAVLPYKVVPKTPRGEDAETEYELPALSSSSTAHKEDLYDDTMNLGPSQEDESNVYELESPLSETPKVQESRKSIPSPSPEEGCECYEDILKHQEPAAESNAYEVEESGFAPAPEPAGENCYEVSEENKDSWAPRDQNGSYPGFRSSVSEGFYSTGDLDSNRGTLPRDGKMSKSEQTFWKKFKITGLEDTLYTTTIVLDFKPEKNTLPLKRGDVVDVIRITDCPPGKWLVKDNQGSYGFVPVSCVDISKDILTFNSQHLLINSGACDIYAEVDRTCDSGVGTDLSISDSYSVKSDDLYDDIDSKRSTLSNSGGKTKGFANLFRKDKSAKEGFWSPSATLNSNAASEEGGENYSNGSSESNAREKEDKSSAWRLLFHKSKEQKGKTDSPKDEGKGNTQAKKLAKEEKIFREKFKYTGEISVYSIATISASVPVSLRDKMALHVKSGEIVDVIDVTNEDQIICRNAEGKYGFVRIEHLNFQPKY